MANLNIKTALTGGTVNCVDRNSAGMKIDGSVCFALIDGSPNVLRAYKFDADSTAIANGNTVIIPYGQSGGTAGRWLQHGIMIGSLTPELLGYIGNLTSDAQTQLNEIQTQIGSYRGVLSSSAATVTLTAEHRGYLIALYRGSAQTVYLPHGSGLPVGWSVTVLIETLTGSAIFDPYEQIDSGSGLVGTLSVRGTEEVQLSWDGTIWLLGGSALRAVGEAASGGIRDVTWLRNFGTTYTNLTLRPMLLTICYRDNGSNGAPTLTVTDSRGTHAMALGNDLSNLNWNQVSVMIEPGADWLMSTTAVTKVAVWEYYL